MVNQADIETIRNFVPRLKDLVDPLAQEQLARQYIENEWTIAQIVHHLLDAHTNAYLLFKRVLTEDEAKLSWLNQDEVANLPDGRRADIRPSLLGLEGVHLRWADMLDNITDWSKSGTSIKSGKIYTLENLLTMYANHCDNHIQQIQDVLNAMSNEHHTVE